MPRTVMYVLIAALCIAVAGLGYYVYEDQNSTAVEVTVGGRTLSVEGR